MSLNTKHDQDDDPSADEITHAAAARGLGSRAQLRTAANVSWSAFIGASLSMLILLLIPEGWLDAPLTFDRLTLLFFGLWALALVPALFAALLSSHTDGNRHAR